MTMQAKLDAAIKAVCPIHGISIGRKDDKATWRIDFKDEATVQERAAAQAVIDAFDTTAAQVDEDAAAARKAADESEAAIAKADNQVLTFLNFSPAQLDSWVDANIPAGGQRTAFKVLGRITLAAGRGKALR